MLAPTNRPVDAKAFCWIAIILLMVPLFTLNIVNATSGPNLQWSQTFGPYEADVLVQTSDGGFAIAGSTATYSAEHRGYSNYLTVLIKTNAQGDLEWKETYDIKWLSPVGAIIQTEDLGYVIGGSNWLLKTDAQGIIQWNKTYNFFTTISDFVFTGDNYFILTGWAHNESTNSESAFIAKVDLNGELLWNKPVSTSSGKAITNSVLETVIETSDQNFVLAGSLENSFWAVETSPDGQVLWSHTYQYENDSVSPPTFYSVAKTIDKGYLFGGTDGYNAWLVKTDLEGNTEWYSRLDYGNFRSVVQAADGYIVFGNSQLVKLNNSGDIQWNEYYNSSDNSENTSTFARCGIVTIDGGFVATGLTSVSSQESYVNIWMAKFSIESTIPPNEASANPTFWIIMIVIILLVTVASFLIYLRHKHRH